MLPMESGIGMRIAGILCAVALGGGLSVFLLGPVLFERMPINSIPAGALFTGVGFAVFGAWLLLVSCIAPLDELKRVLDPFQASEAVVLFLPFMLFIGTRSLWRAMFRRASDER